MQTYLRLSLLLSLVVLCSWCERAAADGGMVRLVEQQGPWRVSVFTSPTPPRAGTVDISVLVQDAETSQPVTDVNVLVSLTPRERSGRAIEQTATFDAATNKLLQAALVELPRAGTWKVQVICTARSDRAVVHFDMEAGEPLPAWRSVWPWFTWPLGVVLLFGVHRLLLRRKHLLGLGKATSPTASSA